MSSNVLRETLGERGQTHDWVTLVPNHNQHRSTGLSQTQLLFNEAIPAHAYNRATHVGPPAPIVIEKLLPRVEERDDVVDSRASSSLCFSALSEERLLAAVRLAKRDLRRRGQESLNNSLIRKSQSEEGTQNKGNVDQQQKKAPKGKSKAAGPKEEVTRSGANVLVFTPQKLFVPPRPELGLSPPTRDPGPGQTASSQEPQLSQEIRRMQRELAIYVQRIEQLANRGRMVEEPLEPDEQRRMEVRRQEQAARSARIIYALQQQVKEIQEDLEKLRSQKIQHTKKSRVVDRLAAAHRRAVQAMQVFTNQLSDPAEGRWPSHYKELGQLIRQLSLCSAKVAVGQGSAVPETALDILQKLETLDCALSKQEITGRSWPVRRRSPHHSVSPPPRAFRGPATRGLRRPRKAAGPRRTGLPGRRGVTQQPRASQPPPPDRSQVLKAGLESLVHLRELREENLPHAPNSKGAALHPERAKTQADHARDVGFQQPTVASRLRVCQLPQKEASVPWMPTSPHSPPRQRQRSPQRRPEPRCLFSPLKASSSPGPSQQLVTAGMTTTGMTTTDQGLSSDKKREAHSAALRQAWLDKMTIQRLTELKQLSNEEAEGIQRLRSEVGSPTPWADRAEQETRKRPQPLLDQAECRPLQATVSADALSEALLEELLDEAAQAAWAAQTDRLAETLAQRRLQAPTLESMLLRMEEMEKDQEAVRRRFAHISYSDPHYWDRKESTDGAQRLAPGSRTASPQPIRLTKPALRHTTTADIVLESPVEAGHSVLSETSVVEEGSPGRHGRSSSYPVPGPATVERKGGTRVSVPGSMLRSLLQYREEHEAYLRLVAHEAVGSFNPWTIANSLAEELMSEALADVAAEFQDVCEEYAEAVFTSEFLQPIQSPPASVPLLDSQ